MGGYIELGSLWDELQSERGWGTWFGTAVPGWVENQRLETFVLEELLFLDG